MISFAEPLYPSMDFLPFEKRLFQSTAVRRLKMLAHLGVGALVSPLIHSRYDHSLGLWKLVSHFFPENKELRAAAILHDVGHLPFSNGIETAFGYDHHEITKLRIQSQEIQAILDSAGIDTSLLVKYILEKSPITGSAKVLGLDHLDYVFRAAYMGGYHHQSPWLTVQRLACSEEGITCDEETAEQMMKLIVKTNEWLCSKEMLATEAVLIEAIKCDWAESGEERDVFQELTDWDVLCILKASPAPRARMLIHTLLEQPDKLIIREGATGKGIPFKVSRTINLGPSVNNQAYIESTKGEEALRRIKNVNNQYEVIDFTFIEECI
ncbi:hypothetical protein JOC54_004400 [Alkalihalobacillus xiaoxiensis]|uniref:HD domain-containing protein n=1 Tax=Shouchella xiaoxiensis TaxID=766895 RepID=A0ABS2SZY7_9BACI|nr:HD domain-containing protein [Shouchella xiaoxiensis]MBM7841101.1 hypothetical protein [Shouchella xiaoxiensis]